MAKFVQRMGVLGHPRFKENDEVGFMFTHSAEKPNCMIKGTVFVVDGWGTFGQNIEPSYDIMVTLEDGNKCLYKHIVESLICWKAPKKKKEQKDEV